LSQFCKREKQAKEPGGEQAKGRTGKWAKKPDTVSNVQKIFHNDNGPLICDNFCGECDVC